MSRHKIKNRKLKIKKKKERKENKKITGPDGQDKGYVHYERVSQYSFSVKIIVWVGLDI
jgi:hypothetical protein